MIGNIVAVRDADNSISNAVVQSWVGDEITLNFGKGKTKAVSFGYYRGLETVEDNQIHLAENSKSRMVELEIIVNGEVDGIVTVNNPYYIDDSRYPAITKEVIKVLDRMNQIAVHHSNPRRFGLEIGTNHHITKGGRKEYYGYFIVTVFRIDLEASFIMFEKNFIFDSFSDILKNKAWAGKCSEDFLFETTAISSIVLENQAIEKANAKSNGQVNSVVKDLNKGH